MRPLVDVTCSLLSIAASLQLAAARPPLAKFHKFDSALPTSQVITGLYANDYAEAQVIIHDVNGAASWTWSVADANYQSVPAALLSCIQKHSAVPEAKWANGGSSILTIYNSAALIINHMPGDPRDKQITFGVCLDGGDMSNAHSLELVPGGRLAIATTSDDGNTGIQIFDTSSGMQSQGTYIQALGNLPAVHGLVWDETLSVLWAVGSSNAPDETAASSPALHAYQYTGGSFQTEPLYSFNISTATALTTEWANTQYSGWWDGGHDAMGIPNKRQLLISTDLDIFVFDISTQTFESGDVVVQKYLPGFTPIDTRVGTNGQALTRSDVKSLSIDGNNNALYAQAAWQNVVSNQINRLGNGQLQPGLVFQQQLYRSRWFANTTGWAKASLSN
jgi:hypothetical protein